MLNKYCQNIQINDGKVSDLMCILHSFRTSVKIFTYTQCRPIFNKYAINSTHVCMMYLFFRAFTFYMCAEVPTFII